MHVSLTGMRIGIDGHVLGKNIGAVERYVEKMVELVPALRPHYQFVVFVTQAASARIVSASRSNVEFVRLPVADPILQRSVVLPWAVRRHRLDAIHVQRIAPWACGQCKIVVTVHDLIPLKYPKSYPGFRNWLVRMLTPGSIRRAHFIVCPTQTVCDDIGRLSPRSSAPRHPYYNGVDRSRFAPPAARPDRDTRRRHGIDGKFLFSPGAIEARKNIGVIIEALARLDPASRPLLVLSGSIRDPGYHNQMRELAARLGVSDRIRYLGFISDDDLVDLYGQATASVAASIDEGFNLLPLEAMACGSRVLCSDIPVHRELFEGAVSFFPSGDPNALAREILGILTVGENDQRRQASAQACVERFSWEAMAERTACFYDTLVPGEQMGSPVGATA